MTETKINRYDHGGARVWIEKANGGRDLVVDIYIYEPAERREAIIAALVATGVIPPETRITTPTDEGSCR